VYERRREADNRSALGRVLATLGHRPAGLITDVDGTISPIVARPDAAVVLPQARAALARLGGLLELVAVVSGRSAREAGRLVGLPRLVYVGNHGLETLADGRLVLEPTAAAWLGTVADTVAELRRRLAGIGGVLVEDKGASISVHFREAVRRGVAPEVVLGVVEGCASRAGLRLELGRMVVNVLPPLAVSKGTAVHALARQHGLRGLVYLGDDLTDTHAFEALIELRHQLGCATLCVAVVGPDTPHRVRELADVALPSAQAVADVLHEAAAALAPALRPDPHPLPPPPAEN
jgi:trehalose 6-phosphate phosphatase